MDELESFLRELERRSPEPLLAHVVGSIRIDAVDGDRIEPWRVEIDHGRVKVSNDPAEADCHVRGPRDLLDDLVAGRANTMAAILRGALDCTGNLDLLLSLQRVFPATSRDHTDRSPR